MIFCFYFDLFIYFYFFRLRLVHPNKKAYSGSVFDCKWFPKLLSNDITNKYIITKVKTNAQQKHNSIIVYCDIFDHN